MHEAQAVKYQIQDSNSATAYVHLCQSGFTTIDQYNTKSHPCTHGRPTPTPTPNGYRYNVISLKNRLTQRTQLAISSIYVLENLPLLDPAR